MSTTKTISTDQKLEFIADEIHDFFIGGYYYDMLPEKLKAFLDKQALELYDLQDLCYKSYEKLEKNLEKIIKEQYPVFSTVDLFWMKEDIQDTIREGFGVFTFLIYSLCENTKDKQPLEKIYAHLGLWKSKSKQPGADGQLLKVLRGKITTLSDPEWDKLTAENKVFELLNYQNNEQRRKPVYDAVEKVCMAAFPYMKQFDATARSIYDALFEEGNTAFRVKSFLLELRSDSGSVSRFFDNSADKIIEKFIKLPKYKREGINKLAERKMRGEKV
jgi:hypothetical protein